MSSSCPRGLSPPPSLQAPHLLLPQRQVEATRRRPAGGHRLSEHSPVFAQGAWCVSNVPSAELRRRKQRLVAFYRFYVSVYLRHVENIYVGL